MKNRPLPTTPELHDAAQAASGGRMTAMRDAAKDSQMHFLMIRSKTGAARITLNHATTMHALWKLWAAKRSQGVDDPGVTISEIAGSMNLTTERVQTTLNALRRNGSVRWTRQYAGYGASWSRFYPTEAGIMLMGVADVLGCDSFVQVGRTSKAWRARSQTEPSNLFAHANMLKGRS